MGRASQPLTFYSMNITDRLRARIQAKADPLVQAPALPSLPHLIADVRPTAPQAVSPQQAPRALSAGDRLDARAYFAKQRPDVAQYAEIIRVCGLPLITDLAPEELEAYCLKNILADQFNAGWRLWPVQAMAVLSYEIYGGLFAPVGVGWGKTLISLMIAQKAFMAGHEKILLLVPASVYPQLVNSNIPWARTKVPLSVPFHGLGGKGMSDRRMISRSRRVGCYLMPYSQLSTEDARTAVDPQTNQEQQGLIEAINPTLIIGDEIHYLANRGSGRSKNIINWMIEHSPEMACMSGTITTKSVMDYHHLMKLSLKKNSPLPLSSHMATDWSQVLDADSYFCDGQTGPLQPLVDWARDNYPKEDFAFDRSGFRKAYRLRLASSPGVVSTGDSEIKTSLTLINQPVEKPEQYEGWEKLTELTNRVVELYETPNGDEIAHRIHSHKWLKELTAGFYNEYLWPTGPMIAKKEGVELEEAEQLLQLSLAHHEKKQAYGKALRRWLKDHEYPGLMTPNAVGNNMKHHGPDTVGFDLYRLWHDMKEHVFEDMPKRYKRAVRVCDFKISAAVAWCNKLKKGEGALVWYQHQEIGEWFMERALAEGGLDVLHCPAGNAANLALDLDQNPQNRNKILVCSISAHQEGKNLQPIGASYFLEWNQSARTSEQTLGRNHRQGQLRDELAPVTCLTTDFDQLSFASTLNDALYIQQTTNNRQKLIYCGYDPTPPVFPPEVLRERGFQSKSLTAEQRTLLEERFGDYRKAG